MRRLRRSSLLAVVVAQAVVAVVGSHRCKRFRTSSHSSTAADNILDIGYRGPKEAESTGDAEAAAGGDGAAAVPVESTTAALLDTNPPNNRRKNRSRSLRTTEPSLVARNGNGARVSTEAEAAEADLLVAVVRPETADTAMTAGATTVPAENWPSPYCWPRTI